MKRLHSWLVVVLMVGVLASCATQPTSDEADLQLIPGVGVVFSAGPDRPALGVTIDLLADEFVLISEACIPNGDGFRCDVFDVEAGDSVTVLVQGVGVSATAAYRRPGSSRVLVEVGHP